MVTTQSNKTLSDKLRSQEEKAKNLQHCEQEMMSLETQNKDLQAKVKGNCLAVSKWKEKEKKAAFTVCVFIHLLLLVQLADAWC